MISPAHCVGRADLRVGRSVRFGRDGARPSRVCLFVFLAMAVLCGCGERAPREADEPSVANANFRFTAHLLPKMGTATNYIAAAVTVTDLKSGSSRDILLPDGASVQRGMAISPDGKFVYTVHGMARYKLPATQVDHGWQCSAAMSVFDAEKGVYLNTVTLDEVTKGAANPWSVAVTPDGAKILVTHAGTRELSIIDRAAFHDRFARRVDDSELSFDFTFLNGIRRRIELGGDGPREFIRVTDTNCIVRLHFAHALATCDYATGAVALRKLPNPPAETSVRLGERLFNDATKCFQQWQSCASCHPDGGKDGLVWDLRGDGIGNPRPTISPIDGTHDLMTCIEGSFDEDLFAEMPAGGSQILYDYIRTLKR